jgi:hypothetical protein
MNREAWLTEAGVEIGALLTQNGLEVPTYRVSVGWPSKGGTSAKKRRIGECWRPEASEDGVSQIYISPVLESPADVLGTLVHEILHALTPGEGHRGEFVKSRARSRARE